MKFKKSIIILLSILVPVCFTLTGCSDDEPVIENPEWPDVPTEDIINTRLQTKTAVFATADGRLLSAVKNRLSNAVVISDGVEIPDDCNLIILDEAFANRFLQSTENFSHLSQYYARGGMIYLHFPRLNQAAIVARLVYNTYNSLPDDGETVGPLFEGYLFDKPGNEKQIHDIFGQDGNSVEAAGGIKDLSDYTYGQIAESIARFVDDIEDSRSQAVKSRSSVQSDCIDKLPFIAKEYDLPPRVEVLDPLDPKHPFVVFMGVTVTAKIRSVYSFEEDKDYYQVILSETVNPYCAGYGTERPEYLCSGFLSGGIDLDVNFSEQGKIYSLSDIQPENKSHDGETVEVTDVSFNAGIELGSSDNRGGFWSGVSYEKHTIKMPVRELTCELKQKNKSNFGWNYTIAGPQYKVETEKKKNVVKYIAPPDIAGKVMIHQQSWTWAVDNPRDSGDDPFKINLGVTSYTTFAIYSKTTGKPYSSRTPVTHSVEIPLPVPSRIKHPLIVVHRVSPEANKLREELKAISPAFTDLAANKTWYAPSEPALYDAACMMWGNAYTEISNVANDKNLGIEGKWENIKFYLHLNNSPVEIYKNSNYRSFIIGEDGKVRKESY